MNIEELPTVKYLTKQMTGLSVIMRINEALRRIGLGSEEIAKLQSKCKEMHQELTEYTEYPQKFNRYFSEAGWLAHDSMSFDVLKRAVDECETVGREQATEVLLDYYGPDQVEERLPLFLAVEALRTRRKFVDYALAENKAGRHYSAVPLLLMVIDGAANDATGKGFHASAVSLEVWDSLLASDGAIYRVKEIFQKGRRKTCTEPIDLPYRNGILHGMDLAYDNRVVTAKCWCFLFVVRDWLVARQSEATRRQAFEDETRTPSLREVVEQVAHTERLRKATEAWEPRDTGPEYIDAINCSHAAEGGSPESIALACLALWKRQNYGDMAKLFWTKMAENPRKLAGEIRARFGSIRVSCYSVLRIMDEAPAIAEVDVRLIDSDDSDTVSHWTFRLVRVDEKGDPVPANLPGGRWEIVWIQQMREGAEKQT